MALNAGMLKDPKILGFGAIAVVGGVYFASKLGTKKQNNTPVEITPSVLSVASNDSLNSTDELTRQLADTQTKLKELQDKQLNQAQPDNRYTGDAYQTQIAELNGQIRILQGQLADKPVTPTVPSVPATPTVPSVPATPTVPSVPATPSVPSTPQSNYPGVFDTMLPENTYRGLLGSYSTVFNNQLKKNTNDTFVKRNMMAIAISGNTTPWLGTGDWNIPATINYRRVHNGLRPLTASEISTMIAQINVWSNMAGGNERAFLSHSQELFERWNMPYQDTGSSRRF